MPIVIAVAPVVVAPIAPVDTPIVIAVAPVVVAPIAPVDTPIMVTVAPEAGMVAPVDTPIVVVVAPAVVAAFVPAMMALVTPVGPAIMMTAVPPPVVAPVPIPIARHRLGGESQSDRDGDESGDEFAGHGFPRLSRCEKLHLFLNASWLLLRACRQIWSGAGHD
jgi:hypothetical protein